MMIPTVPNFIKQITKLLQKSHVFPLNSEAPTFTENLSGPSSSSHLGTCELNAKALPQLVTSGEVRMTKQILQKKIPQVITGSLGHVFKKKYYHLNSGWT